jgi:enoyl-CoA hydratase/carnithine racemase
VGVKKSVIAAVNELGIGIGTTILLHCDLVYAAVGAQRQPPFVNLGIVPEAGSTFILPRILGHQTAPLSCFSSAMCLMPRPCIGGGSSTPCFPPLN